MPVFLMYVFTKPPPRFSPGGGCIGVVILMRLGWSWRYTPAYGDGATLNATNPNGSITCTNTANDKIYWLNGFSQVVRNIFGVSH